MKKYDIEIGDVGARLTLTDEQADAYAYLFEVLEEANDRTPVGSIEEVTE